MFEITRLSIAGLAIGHYTQEQIDCWMGDRTPDFYENLISHGRMVVADSGSVIHGFVDAIPGELTRLFVLPEASGRGLGSRLLAIGIDKARQGQSGPIRLESTLNGVAFYQKHGFRPVGRALFSHGLGGVPTEIVVMELQPADDRPAETAEGG